MPGRRYPSEGDPRLKSPARRRCLATVRARRDPCWRCGHPIDYTLKWPHSRSFVGDEVISRHYGGDPTDPTNVKAAHLDCNARAGAAITNSRPRTRTLPSRAPRSRRRTCEHCGIPYRASYTDQRCCTRTCAVALRRLEQPRTPTPEPRTIRCTECEALVVTTNPHRKTCGGDCTTARNGRTNREHYQNDLEYRAKHLAAMNDRNRRIRTAVNEW